MVLSISCWGFFLRVNNRQMLQNNQQMMTLRKNPQQEMLNTIMLRPAQQTYRMTQMDDNMESRMNQMNFLQASQQDNRMDRQRMNYNMESRMNMNQMDNHRMQMNNMMNNRNNNQMMEMNNNMNQGRMQMTSSMIQF